jgi:hypothetical protein
METELRRKIDKLAARMRCPKQFKCVESDCESLCKARDFGLDSYLVCLEENPASCPFALSFVFRHLCECPVRILIAKRLKQ